MKSKQSEKLIKQQFKLMSNGSLWTANEMTEIDADLTPTHTHTHTTLDSVPNPTNPLHPLPPDRNRNRRPNINKKKE